MKLSLSCLALWQPEWVCLFRVFWPPQDLVSVRHYYAGILQVNIFTQPLISSCFLQLICVSRAYHALDRSETLFACANQHSEPIAKVPVPPNQPRNRRRLKWLLTSHTDHYLLFDVGGFGLRTDKSIVVFSDYDSTRPAYPRSIGTGRVIHAQVHGIAMAHTESLRRFSRSRTPAVVGEDWSYHCSPSGGCKLQCGSSI